MNPPPRLTLRELTSNDETSFFDSMKHWPDADLPSFAFDWKPGMSFAEFLERMNKNKRGEDLAAGRVPATMLYGFVDSAIIGRVHIRHVLNDALLQRGGNLGYAVAPSFRNRGFATEMAKQGLFYSRNILNLSRVLLTCADDNDHSWRIIEKLGGTMENKFIDPTDGRLVRRYWIELR